uniref:NADH-ubiquinone oxidoreductase chain 4 n=1 Tax=Ornithodoros coriaceus TaxID=92741 RepID=A0A3G2KJX5_ORNCO|nr:NADH dehydrogenase subunit 4 [Ornithodoros coriaceus]AYN59506.1 NADH dehydrogenase subunit 4 [Ornithodoros coriaceus]
MLSLLFSMFWILWLFMYFSFLEICFLFICFVFFLFLKVDWSSRFLFVGEWLGMDLMSFLLIELALWVSVLMYLASMNLKIYYEKMFSFYIIMMSVLLVFCFSVLNLMGFYLFFESVLIPIIMMILGWGSQSERLQAGVYMLFYTLFGSLPLFLFFLYMSNNLSIIYLGWMNFNLSFIFFLMGIVGFLVKMPMFLVHMWLPKAHVEAPVAGSMILAGVLLKLGIYGLFRVKFFFLEALLSYGYIIMSITLLGGVYVAFICLCQVDVKSLIAYSSVCHMGLGLGGVISMSHWGAYGNMMMMVGHGLCSSGLFCLANIYYERFFTRSMVLLKGVGHIFPFFSVWWFLFSIVNLSAPPSLNLGGEVFLLGSVMKWSLVGAIPLGVISFLSAGYSLYMYSYLNHGSGWILYSSNLISIREILLMLLHFVPLVIWGLKMELFFMWI